MTPITYAEASRVLGVAQVTINQAANRGVLTKLPTGGLVQHVSKEQLELFKGKKRLSQKSLNAKELEMWEQYRNEILTPASKKADINFSSPEFEAILDSKFATFGEMLVKAFSPSKLESHHL